MRICLIAAGFLLALQSSPAGAEVYGPPEPEAAPPIALDQEGLSPKERRERNNWNMVKPAYILVQAIHVLDGITTVQCGRTKGCEEKNAPFLYGRKPTVGRTIAAKGTIMLATHFLTREASKKSPVAGFTFLAISGGFTAKAVHGNIKLLW